MIQVAIILGINKIAISETSILGSEPINFVNLRIDLARARRTKVTGRDDKSHPVEDS